MALNAARPQGPMVLNQGPMVLRPPNPPDQWSQGRQRLEKTATKRSSSRRSSRWSRTPIIRVLKERAASSANESRSPRLRWPRHVSTTLPLTGNSYNHREQARETTTTAWLMSEKSEVSATSRRGVEQILATADNVTLVSDEGRQAGSY